MRIAITGASGTGKTFLAEQLAKKYNLPLNPIGARSVALAMGFGNPYDVDRAGRRVEFQERLFLEKRAWEEQHDAFVTDRSYFDNLAYCALHMSTELKDDVVAEYTKAMEHYTHVLFCPKRVFQKLDDGIRVTSSAYHELYEIVLGGLLARSSWEREHYRLDMPLGTRMEYAEFMIKRGAR